MPERVSSSEYMRLVAEEWLLSRWWVLALPVAAVCALARWYDPKFWVVVPVIVCLIIPPLLMFLYFTYATTPEAAAAVRPHTTDRHPDGSLTLRFEPEAESGREYEPLRVSAGEIERTEEQGDRLIVHLKGKPFRYIIIKNNISTQLSENETV